MSHVNNGNCLSCAAILNRYPGFNLLLRNWFLDLQSSYPEAHTSCAGRGQIDQQALFQRGATKAQWRQSAHNWNAALDLFQLQNGKALWLPEWFASVIAPRLTNDLTWYGRPGASYYELPHIELASWNEQAKSGQLHLVE